MNYEAIAERFCKRVCKNRIDQFGSWASDIDKELLKQTVDQANDWFDLYTLMAAYIAYDNHMSRTYYRCNPYARNVL